jgi:hypothetical protein
MDQKYDQNDDDIAPQHYEAHLLNLPAKFLYPGPELGIIVILNQYICFYPYVMGI